MKFAKNLFHEIGHNFSTRQFQERIKGADGKIISDLLVRNNFMRMIPLAAVLAVFQIIYIISDHFSGNYANGGVLFLMNITAEILLLVSSTATFLFSIFNMEKLKKSPRGMHRINSLFYAVITVGLSIYIVSDLLHGYNSTTLFFVSVIFMTVPVFWMREWLRYYLTFFIVVVFALVVTSVFTDSTVQGTLSANTQIFLVFISSAIITAYLRVATIRIMFNDIDLNRLNKKLSILSSVDPLTSIANRRSFEDYFNKQLASIGDGKQNIAAAVCDIDNFKNYNDSYSHVAGDEALVRIARVLQDTTKTLEQNGFVARIGGEEFMMVYAGWKDISEVKDFFSSVRGAVEELGIKSGSGATHPVITISIGVAAIQAGSTHKLHDFYVVADAEVYRAKANGRNQVSINGECFQ